MPGPQERAAGDGLVTAVQLQGVVAEGRPEVLPPLGLPVVAVASPGRRARRPRRAGPPRTARPRARARRWTGIRAGRRRSGTRSPAGDRRAGWSCPRRRSGPAGSAGRGSGRCGVAGRMSAASSGVRTSVPVTAGHQASRPNSGVPGGQQRGPAVGARAVHDQTVAVVGVALARRPQPVVHDGRERVGHPQQHQPGRRRAPARPAASASAAAARPELQHQSVVLGGQLAVEPGARRCCGAAARPATAARSARQRGDSGNQSNAQAAANCPAASAMTWLFAEDPRLGKAASQRWWCQIWCSATGLPSNSSAAPGQPSSSRRTHTQDSSRMPSSMPLIQCTPRSGGLRRPPGPQVLGHPLARTARPR